MYENQTEVVIFLAKNFFDLMNRIQPGWERAFFRFYRERSSFGSKASFRYCEIVDLVRVIQNQDFFEAMNVGSNRLFDLLNEDMGVFLLEIDSELGYQISFEFKNIDRWSISKMNGSSGMPSGLQ